MKAIKINPKYLISEDGLTIINEVTGNKIKIGDQVIKGKITGYKYASIIFDEGEYRIQRTAVHRLVAFAYLPEPEPGQVWINHKDGNKSNNHYTNLEWATISENIQHAHDTGLIKKITGAGHWRTGQKASLSTRNKQSIKKQGEKHPKFKGWYVYDFKKYGSAGEASRATGISPKTIYNKCMKGDINNGIYFIPVNK
jgi:hypothetical protein